MGYALTHARYSGAEQPPVGMGSPALAPYGAYATADGQVVVLGTTNDSEWRRLTSLMGLPELADDERYLRKPDRVARRAEVDEIVAAWCAGHRLAEIQEAADKAGIGNARYNTPLEVVAHPDLEARGRWRDVDSPVGPLTALMPPVTIAGYPAQMGPVPGLGEHTAAVLAELGFSQEEITALHETGTV